MQTKKGKCIKNKTKNKTQKGGKTKVTSPTITYPKGNAKPLNLKCSKCNNSSYHVKTLTMGTKTKAFLNYEILDNRFKVFTCQSCGFVEIFSNNIKCNGKECDPLF